MKDVFHSGILSSDVVREPCALIYTAQSAGKSSTSSSPSS